MLKFLLLNICFVLSLPYSEEQEYFYIPTIFVRFFSKTSLKFCCCFCYLFQSLYGQLKRTHLLSFCQVIAQNSEPDLHNITIMSRLEKGHHIRYV